MEKSLFNQMGGTYVQQGNYLLPNLVLSTEIERQIGIWGQRRLRYLKQHYRILYYNLLTSGEAALSPCRYRRTGEGTFLSAGK